MPGTDYTPVSGILTFAPGQTSQTIRVPILSNPGAGTTAFGIGLSSPGGGASIGNPYSVAVTIQAASSGSGQNNTPAPPSDAIGPVVTDIQLQNNGQSITGVVLSFSKALDPGRAQNLANYSNVFRTPGPDGVFNTYDDGIDPIVSASYNSASKQVTLTPASPLPLNVFTALTINQNANTLTGAGVADTSGALLDKGITSAPYSVEFALGSQLSYTDPNGHAVSLNLARGGLMELRLGGDGSAQQLRLSGTIPRRSQLNGSVKGGKTVLPLLINTAGVRVNLRGFIIGAVVNTTPVTPTPVHFVPRPPRRGFRLRSGR